MKPKMTTLKFYRYWMLGFFALLPLNAVAYVGPGLGAGTIGVIAGLVGSIFLALFAFFWYPIKRVLFSKKQDEEDDKDEEQEEKPSKTASVIEVSASSKKQ